jgi:hypothetical protein
LSTHVLSAGLNRLPSALCGGGGQEGSGVAFVEGEEVFDALAVGGEGLGAAADGGGGRFKDFITSPIEVASRLRVVVWRSAAGRGLAAGIMLSVIV